MTYELFGWAIIDKNGDSRSMDAKLIRFFGAVNHKFDPYTEEDAKVFDKEWPGLAPHKVLTLYVKKDDK